MKSSHSRWFLLAAFLGALWPATTQACSVCFGDPDSDLAKGLNAGVLALLIVVGTVLSGFAAFFVFIAKRASLAPAPRQTPADSIPITHHAS